ncbi:MAG: hypothetical protein JOY71_10585 [Acetobacteraceae bacterium]|nr:hypothetical protein [Acetobacteraceae bacterium]MBV8522549.1 hypothetical protein [Acetobacteraceae bacterium]
MRDDLPKTAKREAGLGGLLGALALPAPALFGIALLTLLVWWYFDISGGPLNPAETAVVALVLGVAAAIGRAAWRRLRPHPAPERGEGRE